jgi:hypothetical protein
MVHRNGRGSVLSQRAGAETSLHGKHEFLRHIYSFTCTTCAGSKPLKCVAEALL